MRREVPRVGGDRAPVVGDRLFPMVHSGSLACARMSILACLRGCYGEVVGRLAVQVVGEPCRLGHDVQAVIDP